MPNTQQTWRDYAIHEYLERCDGSGEIMRGNGSVNLRAELDSPEEYSPDRDALRYK